VDNRPQPSSHAPHLIPATNVAMRSRPTVLVTTSTLPRWHGDPEARFVLDLARHLQPRYDLRIVAPAYPQAALDEELEGVQVIRYRYGPLRRCETLTNPGAIMGRLSANPALWALVPALLAGLYRTVRCQIASTRVDCVHAHWLLPQGVVQAALAGRAGAPGFIVTSHGGDMMLADRPLVRQAYRRVLERAAAVTIVSPAIGDDIRRLHPSFDRSRLRLIPMGVDLTRFGRGRRNGGFAGNGTIRVLFAGRLIEKKGLCFLLEALAGDAMSHLPVELWIAGDGPERNALERQVCDRQLGVRVRFFGGVPHGRLEELYAACDIFCAPSVVGGNGDRDGMPTVLAEAAAAGLPLLATDVGGIRLMVVPDRTGLLVPQRDACALGSALSRLVRDAGLRVRLGEGARAHVQAFGWRSIADRYAEIIDEVVERRARRAM
jgi:glycosyltransferase involved in cell wall biosynthesis